MYRSLLPSGFHRDWSNCSQNTNESECAPFSSFQHGKRSHLLNYLFANFGSDLFAKTSLTWQAKRTFPRIPTRKQPSNGSRILLEKRRLSQLISTKYFRVFRCENKKHKTTKRHATKLLKQEPRCGELFAFLFVRVARVCFTWKEERLKTKQFSSLTSQLCIKPPI